MALRHSVGRWERRADDDESGQERCALPRERAHGRLRATHALKSEALYSACSLSRVDANSSSCAVLLAPSLSSDLAIATVHSERTRKESSRQTRGARSGPLADGSRRPCEQRVAHARFGAGHVTVTREHDPLQLTHLQLGEVTERSFECGLGSDHGVALPGPERDLIASFNGAAVASLSSPHRL